MLHGCDAEPIDLRRNGMSTSATVSFEDENIGVSDFRRLLDEDGGLVHETLKLDFKSRVRKAVP
jgi:hypothetical protein